MGLTALARAKINLTLDVLGKRADGYHEVEMVMQTLELSDRLEFTPRDNEIILEAPGKEVPSGEDNLVWRAADLLRRHTGVRAGVSIRLEKQIPVAAGLGGGSADAATTLATLNQFWGTGLSPAELLNLGEQLGSDIPFCLLGGTVLARGRGEKLERLDPCPTMGVVLVKPPFGLSTATVYHAFRPEEAPERPDNRAMVRAIRGKKLAGIAAHLGNALEPAAMKLQPEIARVKKKLLDAGAMGVLMSGSGPTVFGLTRDLSSARKVAERYQRTSEQVLITRTFIPDGQVLLR